MPITELDPVTALVVIDLQKGFAAEPRAHPMHDVIARASALAQAFRARGQPVVLVNVLGRPPGRSDRPAPATRDLPADWAELVAELGRHPEDHLVSKRTPGAFTDTDLQEFLTARGATQIVLAGVSTSGGVEATGRHAFELGLNVTFALDAITDPSEEAHRNSVERIFPKLGETGSSQAIISRLDRPPAR